MSLSTLHTVAIYEIGLEPSKVLLTFFIKSSKMPYVNIADCFNVVEKYA